MDRLALIDRRTSSRIARVVGGVSLALLIVSLLFLVIDLGRPQAPGGGSAFNNFADIVEAMGVCVLAILITVKRPSNSVGWIFLFAGFTLALSEFSTSYAERALVSDPGSLPWGHAFGWISNSIWPFPTAMLFLLLLLFPTGAPLSRRWRPVVIAGLALAAMVFVLAGTTAISSWNDPFQNGGSGPNGLIGVLFFIAWLLGYVVMLVLSLVAVVIRFRRSRGEERLQLKWFTFAAGFVVATSLLNTFFYSDLTSILSSLCLMGLWVAIGISMLKYRLYDIDLVIRKTVVGGVLVAFVTVVYAGVVAGVGALGSRTDVMRSGPLIAVATAIVAVAFQPVLRRARHLANRLVYGERATPYEILSEFSERMGESYATDDLPPRMARILAEGTGAAAASVWLHVGNELQPSATWPADTPPSPAAPAPVTDEDPPTIPGVSRAFAVRHHGELLGALSVLMPPDDPLGPEQERLCEDLASQAGLVLRNVRLIEELRASRQRMVKAQDVAARRLERNIHDGAQQQLVALSVKLRLLGQLVDRDPEKTKSLAAQLQAESTEALENLRDLARGIYPPLLADKGLAVALDAQARKSTVPVSVDSDGIGRYAQEIEAAVYFCCLEALQNIAKYAGASVATIRLSNGADTLTFEVADDGAGFDPNATGYGTGLQGMADRLDALGGVLDVRSAPDQGTTVVGQVPGVQTRGDPTGVSIVATPPIGP